MKTHEEGQPGASALDAWLGDWSEVLCAAHRLAKQTPRGIAYAVRWPAGHCTVEEKTPLIKDRSMRIVLVTADGKELLA